MGSAPLFAGAVDSLIIIAYIKFNVDDRLTYPAVFSTLERCLPFIDTSNITTDDLSIGQNAEISSIRYVVAAFYKIGGVLFNASKPESAIGFIQRACQIGRSALTHDGISLGHGELRAVMPKRWELLALAYQSIGEKQVSSLLLSYRISLLIVWFYSSHIKHTFLLSFLILFHFSMN